MKQEITIPKEMSLRTEFKRKFSFGEMYFSFVNVVGAVPTLSKNKKSGLVHPDFIERLRLAITEVNGCAACSYAHTKMALKQGMSNEEISSFLSGKDNFIRPEEAKAIMFAQHFAESKGHPDQFTFESLIKEYGNEKADVILAASKVMIAGNMYGLPLSAFLSRFKGRKYKNSSLFYELGMMIFGVLILPFVIIHGLFKG
ncbi:MAG TPA: carboxymuconolactone decarboxylase family protein [Brumimicrobium sp.]|nr:carboxymuconolactone decarboxylase family protein [Brumimicrobium sp.]